MRETSSGRLFSITEPLPVLLTGLFFKLATLLDISAPAERLAYIVLSIASGIFIVILYYLIAQSWFGKTRWLVILLLSTTGFNELFYGYIESYAIFILATSLYYWYALRAIEGKSRVESVSLLFSFAIAVHSAALFLLPSLFYLWWKNILREKIGVLKLPGNALLAASIPVATLAVAFLSSRNSKYVTQAIEDLFQTHFLPAWQGISGYGVISILHLSDFSNLYLLTMPAVLFALFYLLVYERKQRLTATATFLLVAIGPALLFALLIIPRLGLARDWDLFSWTSVPIVFLTLLWLKRARDRDSLLKLGAIVSVWLFIPWVFINSSEHMSVKRFSDILHWETKYVSYGYMNLATYYEDKKQPEMIEWCFKQAIVKEPSNAKWPWNAGSYFATQGDFERAIEYFKKAVKLDSTNATYWSGLGIAMYEMDNPEVAIPAFIRVRRLDPANAMNLYNLGICHMKLAHYETADTFFSLAYEKGMKSLDLYYWWGSALVNLNEYQKAEQVLKSAIENQMIDESIMYLYDEIQATLKQNKSLH